MQLVTRNISLLSNDTTRFDFYFQNKKPAPLSPKTWMSMLISEIQVLYLKLPVSTRNYGTVYIKSTISMHALCNIDLIVMYVDKVQCTPPPPFF